MHIVFFYCDALLVFEELVRDFSARITLPAEVEPERLALVAAIACLMSRMRDGAVFGLLGREGLCDLALWVGTPARPAELGLCRYDLCAFGSTEGGPGLRRTCDQGRERVTPICISRIRKGMS